MCNLLVVVVVWVTVVGIHNWDKVMVMMVTIHMAVQLAQSSQVTWKWAWEVTRAVGHPRVHRQQEYADGGRQTAPVDHHDWAAQLLAHAPPWGGWGEIKLVSEGGCHALPMTEWD